MKRAYQQTIEEISDQLHSNNTIGLSSGEIQQRLDHYGFNTLPEKKPVSWFHVFISQFSSPLIYILLAAAVLIYFVSDSHFDAFIIAGILFFNAIIGTIQEGRTRKILFGLKKFITVQAIVLRNGIREIVDAKNVVPGDIIIIQEGQRVPADARLIEVRHLKIDESMLTGESEAIDKKSEVIDTELPLAERSNMIYSGTYVLSGWAKAIVIATGSQTEIGAIQSSVEEIQTDVPLARELQRLSWWILIFILGMCLFLFLIGLLSGKSVNELIVMLTALFICVVPEGLPVVLTLVLVSGVYRMARQQVLVKNMQAVEGLGHVQVIIIDKTGTLTRNEMVVTTVFANNTLWTVSGKGYYAEGELFKDGKPITISKNDSIYELGRAIHLLSYASVISVTKRGTFEIKGDPTEAALAVFAHKIGIDNDNGSYQQLYEIPFESRHKYHALFYNHNGKGIVYLVGSPEEVLNRSASITVSVDAALNTFLQDGLRVLAVAKKEFELPKKEISEQERAHYYEGIILHDLIFLGLCGIQDAIRPEARATIAHARNTGLHIIMATGDHQRTALSIARTVGIYQEGDEAIDAAELVTMSDAELAAQLPKITVFSRVSAQQKLKIVQLLHERGKMVAMTGDGINDAPSLVAADIGIGMGGIGSEIAQQASDILLLDDSISNIIKAVEEGRHIIYTLRRVILYFFSTNFAEILIILFSFLLTAIFPSLQLGFPLLAAQILWLNLITDGFLDSALAMEKKERKLLHEHAWLENPLRLIDSNLLIKMTFMALPMALGSLWIFMLYDHINLTLAHTMTLVTLAAFQWFNAWNCRSERESIFSLGLTANRWLIMATLFVIFLQLLMLHVPFLQILFKTVPLNIYQWIFIVLLSSTVLWLEELRKLIVRTSRPG